MIPVIVTVGAPDRCVVFGWAEEMPVSGGRTFLRKARMVLYWPSGGLFGLAHSVPAGTRLTCAADTDPGEVVRVIAVTPEGAAALDAAPVYR